MRKVKKHDDTTEQGSPMSGQLPGTSPWPVGNWPMQMIHACKTIPSPTSPLPLVHRAGKAGDCCYRRCKDIDNRVQFLL